MTLLLKAKGMTTIMRRMVNIPILSSTLMITQKK